MDLIQLWPVIAFMILQTVAAIWWAATVSSDVKYIKTDMSDIKEVVHQHRQEHKEEIKEVHTRINYLSKVNGRG